MHRVVARPGRDPSRFERGALGSARGPDDLGRAHDARARVARSGGQYPADAVHGELDRAKREATLHKIQQLIHERAMFAPVRDFAFLHGVGSASSAAMVFGSVRGT